MQHEVIRPQRLFGSCSLVNETGWAKKPLWDYNYKGGILSLHESDCYLITSHKGGWCLLISIARSAFKLSYSLLFADLNSKKTFREQASKAYTKALKLEDPKAPEYCFSSFNQALRLAIIKTSGKRRILAGAVNASFDSEEGLDLDLTLVSKNEAQSLCFVQSLEQKKRNFSIGLRFYDFAVSGTLKLGDRAYDLEDQDIQASLLLDRSNLKGKTISCSVNTPSFGLNLNDKLFYSNAMIKDGIIKKLGEQSFTREDGNWLIDSPDLRLAFEPYVQDGDFLIGLFNGNLKGEDRSPVEDAPGLLIIR